MAKIYGTLHDDISLGSKFDDLVWSMTGNDIVYGRSGDDIIQDTFVSFGRSSEQFPDNDQYYGGAGDDDFRSMFGHDFMVGGRGSDHFEILNHDGVDINGGSGNDAVDFWFSRSFDVLLTHDNKHGRLDHMVIEMQGEVYDIKNVEVIDFHHY